MKQQNMIRISYEQLAEFLNLREDHQVIDVIQGSADRALSTFNILIQGPEMMIVPEAHYVAWIPSDEIPTGPKQCKCGGACNEKGD